MTNDETNVARRGEALETYWQVSKHSLDMYATDQNVLTGGIHWCHEPEYCMVCMCSYGPGGVVAPWYPRSSRTGEDCWL